MSVYRIKQALQELEEHRVPDNLDLWPAIKARTTAGGSAPALRESRTRTPGARFTPRRQLHILVATAVLLIALLVVELLPAALRGGPATAAALLNRMAEVAAAQPAAAEAAGGYRYTRSEDATVSMMALAEGAAFSVLVPKVREMWIAPDGSGRIRETAGEPIFLGDRDRARWEAAGSPTLVHPINEDFGPGGLSAEDFSRYPTDPAALSDVIREQATQPSGPPVNAEMFVLVSDLLRQPGVPPELRAALYRVAAGIEGVELVGPMADRIARVGHAVAMTSDHSGAIERHTLIIDSETSALLGEERVLLERVDWIDVEPPAIIGYATYLESRIVPELP